MPGGYGFESYVGWVEEPSWNTPVTPATKFAELISETVKAIRNREPRPVVRDIDIREGNTYDAKFGGDGGFLIEANYGGLLRLLEHLFGDSSVDSVELEAAISWTHTITLQKTIMAGKGLTLYTNTDVDNGALPVKQLAGYKINSLRLSMDPTRNMQVEFGGAGHDVVKVAVGTFVGPGIANYVAGHQLVCEIDTVVRSIDSVELTIDNGLDLDKRIHGSKRIDEPVRGSARRSITGSIQMDAVEADLDKFLAGTLFQLELLHTGPTLGANAYRWDMTMLKCEVVGDPINISSFGKVKSNFEFRVLKPTTGELIEFAIVNDETVVA